MKKLLSPIVLLLLIPLVVFSNESNFAITKQKTIKKTYLVNSDASLAISNLYGNITVMCWDEDKIDLDIVIKASSNSEKWVNQRLNDIAVDIVALKGIVTAKTILASLNVKNKNGNNSFEINYIIKIPRNSANVSLTNKFGDITAADLKGTTAIDCKYGTVNLARLTNEQNTIAMSYCNHSKISFLNNGSITAKYSELAIDEVNQLDLNSEYTNVAILNATAIKYTSKYGTLDFKNVKNLNGLGNYLKLKIGALSNSLNINTKYSDINLKSINAKANTINLVTNFSNINLGYSEGFDFDFEIATKYANVSYPNDLIITSKEETNLSKKYTGYSKKNSGNSIKISADYGNISLTNK